MNLPLKDRLLKAASLVGYDSKLIAFGNTERYEQKTVVADVGCDHAYLSIFLALEGKCDLAIASDLREGPLKAAKENVLRYGCENKIVTLLTGGLMGVEVYSPTDIVICGMGGETIAEILNDAPWTKKQGMRLILQPQSGAAELLILLSYQGFRVVKERYAFDAGKPYRIFKLVFDGVSRLIDPEEAIIGRLYEKEDRDAYVSYLLKTAKAIEKKTVFAKILNPENQELERLLTRIQTTVDQYSQP